ncbi:MAG TPA: condensation domain-containing protein, partial [Streptosporangiaceae bacterium]|nr:condensation domain-containing protein [Streptosporangiaceae bacterium]
MDQTALRQEIAELERRLALARGQVPRRRDPSRAGLSFMQSQLWFLEQLAPGRPTYHITVARRVRGPLDVPALREALSVVVTRHEALRTTFGVTDDGIPFQVIRAAGAAGGEGLVVEQAGVDFRAQLREAAARPFDFANEPLFRVRLLRLAPEDHVLWLTMHHMCADGWSVGLLLRELAEVYAGVLRGALPELPELAVQPGDLADWQIMRQREGALEEDLAYWEQRLRGAVPVDLPADRPRPSLPSYRGDGLAYLMPLEVLEGARDVARRGGTTLFAVVVAALKAVLARWTGLDDIVIGTADSGRFRPELEPMVGCLINMMALRTDLSGDPSFAELASRVSAGLAEAMNHRGVPLDMIVERLNLPRDPSRNPLFQIAIDIQQAAAFEWELPGCVIEPVEGESTTSRFDMAINTYETPAGLAFRVEFAADLFDRSRVERLLGHLERVLRAVAADAGVRVSGLP